MVSSLLLKEHWQNMIGFTYFGVIALRVAFFMRWERELDDGVLLICWSGVVRGPNILAIEQKKHVIIQSSSFFVCVFGCEIHTFLIRSCMDIGVLNDHMIIVSMIVVTDHKLTPVLHWQTQETLNHLRETERKNSLVKNRAKTPTSKKLYFCKRSLTFGCRFVSCRMVIGSGSGTA